MVEKVIRDGNVAVLISPGYGAGWSTWVDEEHAEAAIFDARFVASAEAGIEDIEALAKEVFSDDDDLLLDGWRNVQVKWLPIGTRFRISEYDGYETIITAENDTWLTA